MSLNMPFLKYNDNKKIRVRPDFTICLVLAVCVCIVYGQVHDFEFTNYDDGDYVLINPHIKDGLTLESVRWAFVTNHASNWHPVTWLSHMVDIELYGMNPGAHHLMNVLFHILNTLLLFMILNRMTRRIWESAVVALLFAVHPLHVESVAWISERKDVLCTLWAFLSIWAYMNYVKTSRIVHLAASLFLFCLGLMSKPMIVSLPVLLMLLDYWPLNRIPVNKISTVRDFFR